MRCNNLVTARGKGMSETRGQHTPENLVVFGQLLRRLREYYSLSQHELSRLSGVPLHTIHRLEQGQIAKPFMEDIAKLAKFFGLDLNTIGVLMGLWDPDHLDEEIDPELSRLLMLLRQITRELTPEDQRRLALQLQPLVTYWEVRRGETKVKRELPPWVLQMVTVGPSKSR